MICHGNNIDIKQDLETVRVSVTLTKFKGAKKFVVLFLQSYCPQNVSCVWFLLPFKSWWVISLWITSAAMCDWLFSIDFCILFRFQIDILFYDLFSFLSWKWNWTFVGMWTWKDHIGTQFCDTTVTYFHPKNDPRIASDCIYFDWGGGGGGSQEPQ